MDEAKYVCLSDDFVSCSTRRCALTYLRLHQRYPLTTASASNPSNYARRDRKIILALVLFVWTLLRYLHTGHRRPDHRWESHRIVQSLTR